MTNQIGQSGCLLSCEHILDLAEITIIHSGDTTRDAIVTTALPHDTGGRELTATSIKETLAVLES